MTSKPILTLVLAAFAATAAQAQTRPQPSPQPSPAPAEAPTAAVAPPAPAFKVGAAVADRDGLALGAIEGLAEGLTGEMEVIVKLDGKLVGIPESDLKVQDGAVVSSRSKAQILAAAGAPN